MITYTKNQRILDKLQKNLERAAREGSLSWHIALTVLQVRENGEKHRDQLTTETQKKVREAIAKYS